MPHEVGPESTAVVELLKRDNRLVEFGDIVQRMSEREKGIALRGGSSQ